jgi:hypothetical protein
MRSCKRLFVTEGDVTRHYDKSASFAGDVIGATVSVAEIFA